MGLRDEIQTEVGLAFNDDLADAVQTIIVVDNKNSIYNPTTGDYSESGLTYSTRGVMSSYTQLEIRNSGGAIDITDNKVLILTNEISVILRTDYLLRIGSLEYRILKIKLDPAKATYTLQVRES